MKIFNINADVNEKQEHEITLNRDGSFLCPVCQNAFLNLVPYQYHSTDPHYMTDRADCPQCRSTFFLLE